MASKGSTICNTDFPLYAIRMVGDKHFLVAGGGGQAKTGIKNAVEIFELKYEKGSCVANHVNRFETGDRATMNCDFCLINSVYAIAAGQDEGCQLYTLRSKVQALKPQNADQPQANETGVRKRKSSSTKSQAFDNAKKSIVFNLETDTFRQTDFDVKGAFQKAVHFAPDHKHLVTGGSDGHIRIWQYPSMEKSKEIKAHSDEVDDLCISPFGSSICSIGKDKCTIWSLEDGSKKHDVVWAFSTKSKYRFRHCRFGKVVDKKDEYRLFTSHIPVVRSKNALCYLTKWETQNYKPHKTVCTDEEIISSIALSTDGTYLGVGTISGSVNVYISFNLQKFYSVRAAHSIFVTGLEFIPNSASALAVTGGHDFSLLSISADNHIKLHQAQPTPLYSVIWPIIGAIVLLYLLFWFLVAFGF